MKYTSSCSVQVQESILSVPGIHYREMATEEQVQKLITLVETQMTALTNLSEENAKLRVEVATATAATPQTSKSRSKRPDRPLINAGIDDREWELIREAWTRYKLMCDNFLEAVPILSILR